MKKRIFPLVVALLAALVICGFPGVGLAAAATTATAPETPGQSTSAADANQALTDQMGNLDMNQVQQYLTDINRDINTYIPELNLKEMVVKLARGELGISAGEVVKGLLKYLFREMVANSKLLGQLLILTVLCAILQNVQSAFEKSTVSKVAWSVCFLVLLSLALGSFAIAVKTGRETIESMVSFMQAMIPVLLTLLTAMGNITSATLFHPLTLVVLSTLGTLIANVVFPLIFFSVILGLANNITSRVEISKLAGLFKTWSMALLGLFMTVFIGFNIVQGIAGGVADGVALRTAKFGIGVFVPVVGKMFSDTLEAVIGTSILLKNAVGLIGIIAVFFICAFPVLKIVALMFIYKIAAAIAQPVGDKLISDSLNVMSNGLTLVFVSVTAVCIMFFFVIAIIIGVGDFSVMLR